MERATGKGQAPTLSDVAKAAGVSTATVSRCLNEPAKVQPDTRRRVDAAIRELGYSPNFGARALAARRTNTMGAIVPTLENAIFARGLEAFQRELSGHGVTLLVASSSYRRDVEAKQVRTLAARGADGLLLIGHDRAPDTYDFLDRRGVPHVVAWAFDPRQPRVSVGFDNRRAMLALAREVIGLGHRSLGLVTAERSENDRARERWAGVCDAMRAAGLDERALAVSERTYAIEDGRLGFRDVMSRDPRPTAIFCGNDVLAAGALAEARDMGLDVPGDVSITGFDDIEISEIVTPALTTVHVPHRQMGRRAAQMLVAMRNGEDPGPSVELETAIRRRGSLAPPR